MPGLIALPMCVVGRVPTYDEYACCVQHKYIFEYLNRPNVVNLPGEIGLLHVHSKYFHYVLHCM